MMETHAQLMDVMTEHAQGPQLPPSVLLAVLRLALGTTLATPRLVLMASVFQSLLLGTYSFTSLCHYLFIYLLNSDDGNACTENICVRGASNYTCSNPSITCPSTDLCNPYLLNLLLSFSIMIIVDSTKSQM